jgi:hypothetical protein
MITAPLLSMFVLPAAYLLIFQSRPRPRSATSGKLARAGNTANQ